MSKKVTKEEAILALETLLYSLYKCTELEDFDCTIETQADKLPEDWPPHWKYIGPRGIRVKVTSLTAEWYTSAQDREIKTKN